MNGSGFESSNQITGCCLQWFKHQSIARLGLWRGFRRKMMSFPKQMTDLKFRAIQSITFSRSLSQRVQCYPRPVRAKVGVSLSAAGIRPYALYRPAVGIDRPIPLTNVNVGTSAEAMATLSALGTASRARLPSSGRVLQPWRGSLRI
jgi:hypothetical protein